MLEQKKEEKVLNWTSDSNSKTSIMMRVFLRQPVRAPIGWSWSRDRLLSPPIGWTRSRDRVWLVHM